MNTTNRQCLSCGLAVKCGTLGYIHKHGGMDTQRCEKCGFIGK